jgi:putative addiction module component (TIGR02574 family)
MTELIAEISKLSVRERILLIQEILQTISEESDAEAFSLTENQRKELDKRSAAIQNGEVATVSWDVIKAKLEQRYGASN